MKKIMLFFLIIVLVFSSGCMSREQKLADELAERLEAQAQEIERMSAEAQRKAEDTVNDLRTPSVDEEIVDVEEEIVNEIPKENQAVIDAMNKFLAKGEEYSYKHTGPDQHQFPYWIKGDKVKIIVLDHSKLSNTVTKNVVYLNKKADVGEWYCEAPRPNSCVEGHGPFGYVTFDEYYRKSPRDWLLELGQDFKHVHDERIHGYTHSVVDFDVDGEIFRVWINTWNGLIIRIEHYADSNFRKEPIARYLFEDVKFEVGDSEINP